MTDQYFILKNKKIITVDLTTWLKWFGTTDRYIGNDHIGDIHVSTVFLGIDHNFGVGEPLLFETMIFGGKWNKEEYQERYSTYEEAAAGHKKAVALVRSTITKKIKI